MYPILGRYGSFFLYSYTVCLAVGIGLSTALLIRQAGKRPFLFDLILLCGGTAVLLGRLGFFLVEQAYFREEPAALGNIWEGGFAYHGALLGGLLGIWLWQRWRGTAVSASILPALAAPLALLHLFGWTACLLEGCAHGQTTTLGLLTADLPDTLGVYAVRYQTQLLGIVGSLLILLLAWRQPSFWLALTLLAILHLGLTLVRGDVAIVLAGWRLDTLLSAAIALISLILLQYRPKQRR